MPALKYWDGAAWQALIGGGGAPSYRQVAYSARDDATINVGATAYGSYAGPAVAAWIGANGVAMLFFYAQVGLSSGSDLIATFDAGPVGGTSGTYQPPSDANCMYVAPDGPVGGTNGWEQGPGHISGVMLATGLTAGQWQFNMHYRVSTSVTSMLRRRLVVIPSQLTVP